MPADPAEYQAATSAAALFDRSDTPKLLLTGPDAPDFVHRIATNQIADLPVGGGCDTFFCDARARALFRAAVYHVAHAGDHALWAETDPGHGDGLLRHLDKFLISEAVEIADVTARYAQFHLAGPAAARLLEAVVGGPVPELAEFQHMERTAGATTAVSVRRRDPLGLPGFDLVVEAARADALVRLVTAAGAVRAAPCTFEVLRIEAGTPVAGVDFDAARFVLEVGGAARAVSYAKGCFPGQEPVVMARDRAGRVNRQFVGLKGLSADPLPPGGKLTKDGREVGVLTSAADSPAVGGPLALGYVHWADAAAGTRLAADGRPVEVVGLPPIRR